MCVVVMCVTLDKMDEEEKKRKAEERKKRILSKGASRMALVKGEVVRSLDNPFPYPYLAYPGE